MFSLPYIDLAKKGSCELCQYSALKGIEGNLEHEAPSALFMGVNPEMSG